MMKVGVQGWVPARVMAVGAFTQESVEKLTVAGAMAFQVPTRLRAADRTMVDLLPLDPPQDHKNGKTAVMTTIRTG
jgi:hypothetical protein